MDRGAKVKTKDKSGRVGSHTGRYSAALSTEKRLMRGNEAPHEPLRQEKLIGEQNASKNHGSKTDSRKRNQSLNTSQRSKREDIGEHVKIKGA